MVVKDDDNPDHLLLGPSSQPADGASPVAKTTGGVLILSPFGSLSHLILELTTMKPLKLARPLAENTNADHDDVLVAKHYLRDMGFYEAPEWGVTEFPDRALFDAIRAFQSASGLKVDGVMKPEGESEGAIRKIHTVAKQLQDMGRHGDTILAHITPAEAELLHRVTDGGSINPVTGLPEFFLGDFFSGLSSSFSGLGDSFMSGLSNFGDSLSSIGDSFSSGLSSFSDGVGDAFGDIGDSLSKGFDSLSAGIGDTFNDMFGANALGEPSKKAADGLGGNLGKNMASRLEKNSVAGSGLKGLPTKKPNLLEHTPSSSGSPFLDSVRRNAGLKTNNPAQAKPVRTISAHNAFGDKSAKGFAKPASPAQDLAGQRRANMAAFRKASAENLKRQSLPQNRFQTPRPKQPLNRMQDRTGDLVPAASNDASKPGGDFVTKKPAPYVLSGEAHMANGRLAKSLAKTSDFSGIKRHITPSLEKGDPKAIAETHDLVEQMNHVSPGHGDKLAKELGLSEGSGRDNLNSLPSKTENAPQLQSPLENVRIRNDDSGFGHFGADRDGGRRMHKGVDLEVNSGTSVRSPIEGRIEIRNTYLPEKDKYGGKYKNVWIIDKDGNEYGLGYVSAKDANGNAIVSNGQHVKAGDVVGIVQNRAVEDKSGKMKNHIHFMRKNPKGVLIDPTQTVNRWLKNRSQK